MKDFFGMFLFLGISGLIVGGIGIYELWNSIPDVKEHCKGIPNRSCTYIPEIPIEILICSISLLVIAAWVLYNKPCYQYEIDAAEQKKEDKK